MPTNPFPSSSVLLILQSLKVKVIVLAPSPQLSNLYFIHERRFARDSFFVLMKLLQLRNSSRCKVRHAVLLSVKVDGIHEYFFCECVCLFVLDKEFPC